MKPFQIAIGIAGVSLLFVGAMALRSKLEYDKDGREITRLIAEYKALGVPTTGAEYFHKVPDSQNAWVDLEPIFFTGKGSQKSNFKSGLAIDFLTVGEKKDHSLMDRYLGTNKVKRDQIAAAIRSKPFIQVPHDYDTSGTTMLLYEFVNFKTVATEFCLDAYSAALKGDSKRMIDDLQVAILLSNSCIDRNEDISILVGNSIRNRIRLTSLRIVEHCPTMFTPLRNFMVDEARFSEPNLGSFFRFELLTQIATARYMDVPSMDKKELPSFLEGIFGNEGKASEEGPPKHTDYIPKSPAMRSYLRSRLEIWKPLIDQANNWQARHSMPTFAQFDHALQIDNAPKPLLKILGLGDEADGSSEQMYAVLRNSMQDQTANLLVWRILDAKRETGHFPKSLSETGEAILNTPGEELIYIQTKNGFKLTSKPLVENENRPIFSAIFPSSDIILTSGPPSHRDKIEDFRNGKIDRDARELR